MLKVFLITAPCSGKSLFVAKHGTKSGILFIDQDDITSKLPEETRRAPEKEKADALLDYLDSVTESAVMLGSYCPSDPGRYTNLTIACVLLPATKHFYYMIKRRARYAIYRILNFLPKYTNFKPDMKWSNWSNISKRRNTIVNYANKNGLDIFTSFEEAMFHLKLDQQNKL